MIDPLPDEIQLPPVLSADWIDRLAKRLVDVVWDKLADQGEVLLTKLFERVLEELLKRFMGTGAPVGSLDELRARLMPPEPKS